MTMRFNQIVTHFQPEEALTIIEFLDQLREVLMNTYGNQIEQCLKEARSAQVTAPPSSSTDDPPF